MTCRQVGLIDAYYLALRISDAAFRKYVIEFIGERLDPETFPSREDMCRVFGNLRGEEMRDLLGGLWLKNVRNKDGRMREGMEKFLWECPRGFLVWAVWKQVLKK